jgi:hypothetical protein
MKRNGGEEVSCGVLLEGRESRKEGTENFFLFFLNFFGDRKF